MEKSLESAAAAPGPRPSPLLRAPRVPAAAVSAGTGAAVTAVSYTQPAWALVATSRGECLCGRRLPDAGGIARTRAVMPRLDYARGLLGDVRAGLSRELRLLSRRNRLIYAEAGRALAPPGPHARAGGAGAPSGPRDPAPASFRAEATVRLAVLALAEAHLRLGRTGQAADAAPAAIPVMRHVSSALHAAFPDHSGLLCEASSVLGGALADLAAVTGARLDFGRSNAVSSGILAQAKLTTESKLAKLYPNMLAARPRL